MERREERREKTKKKKIRKVGSDIKNNSIDIIAETASNIRNRIKSKGG